ncbi:hypothetical protein J4Q44_G00266270 [Coregonus suidteri]|uniref:Uncharacterized protein n=1 Tax=Coregonus suidteri TaxID=861788 RepID=A0AAN8QUE0_9TELE
MKEPYINCVVCNKNFHDSTDPYIDCVRNKDVKTRDVIRHDKCSTLLRGAETAIASNDKEDHQTGCFGCF